LRGRAFQLFKVGAAADCHNTLAFGGQRLNYMKLIIDSDYFSIGKDEISCLSKRRN
jgi:hypothetical protein